MPSSPPSIPDLTDADAVAACLEAPLVLIEFWADWCPHCGLMHPKVEQTAARYPDRLTVARVDAGEHPGLARARGIHSIPSAALYRDGTQVDVWFGAQPLGHLTQAVEAHLNAPVPNPD